MYSKILPSFIGVISIYGEYNFTRSYKRIHRLIVLKETKEFVNDNTLGK